MQFGEDPTQLVTAGIDNMIKIWDSRKNALLTEVGGHTDTVTGMSLNPDGTHVLTNAMDNTLRVTVSELIRNFIDCLFTFLPGYPTILHRGKDGEDVLRPPAQLREEPAALRLVAGRGDGVGWQLRQERLRVGHRVRYSAGLQFKVNLM